MALSNLNKYNLNSLLSMINNNHNDENNIIESIKGHYSTYAKLECIAKQIYYLKIQANEILNNYQFNKEINSIECKFKKVPGNYYYCYKHHNKKVISLIPNDERNIFDEFICKLYFDYDSNFYIIN